jgi:hypothetical protein
VVLFYGMECSLVCLRCPNKVKSHDQVSDRTILRCVGEYCQSHFPNWSSEGVHGVKVQLSSPVVNTIARCRPCICICIECSALTLPLISDCVLARGGDASKNSQRRACVEALERVKDMVAPKEGGDVGDEPAKAGGGSIIQR